MLTIDGKRQQNTSGNEEGELAWPTIRQHARDADRVWSRESGHENSGNSICYTF